MAERQEEKHGAQHEGKHESKQQPEVPAGYAKPAFGQIPAGFKPDPLVIPGCETDPAGVFALQPDALKEHEARVKEAAKQAEKAKAS